MPQLNPAFFVTQIFWLAVVFLLLYVFVIRSFFPRMSSLMNERQTRIEADVNSAETLAEKHAEVSEKCKILVEEARIEAFSLVDAASQKAEFEINEKVASLEEKINKDTAKQEEKLFRQKSKILDNITEISKPLSEKILDKLLKIDGAEVKEKVSKRG